MGKIDELYSKTMEHIEDSFDDKDFIDIYGYEDDSETEESYMCEVNSDDDSINIDECECESEDEFIDDLEETSSQNLNAKTQPDLSVKIEPGSVYGIRNYTDKQFDEEKARKMFYEGNEKDQIEALLYAQFYARKLRNCKPAHMFIMRILTKDVGLCKSTAVYEQAQYSFYYFFRTYLLRECQRFASSRNIPQNERADFIDEALQNCHAYVFKALPKYDVDSGFAISTYFQPFIKDALTSWESLRKGRTSKSTMRTDAAIVNAQKELMAEGITPTPVLVALRTRRKVEETSNSMARIKAENTMVSKEANDLILIGKKQDTFLEPDKNIIRSEMTETLITALQLLNPVQTQILCYTLGIEYDKEQNAIIDSECGKIPLKQIATRMGIDVGEAKALQVSAKRHLEKAMRSYMSGTDNEGCKEGNDTLLRGRHIIFSSAKGDDDMMEIIGEIDKVTDGTKRAVTETRLDI